MRAPIQSALPTMLVFLACGLLLSCNKPPQQSRSAPASTSSNPPASTFTPKLDAPTAGHETNVVMHNVILNEPPGFHLRVRWLRGQMRPTRRDVIPSFDEPSSFVLDIQSGVIATKLDEIGSMMNGGLLQGTPLEKVSLTAQGKQLRMNGTLRKGVPLPIEMTSDVGAAPDGRIRLHVVKMRVLKLPVTGLLQSFHVKVGDLVGARGAAGVQVIGDDIYISPDSILPAPAIRGRLTDAHIGSKSGDLITVFGDARPEVQKVKEWRNFMRFSGGTLIFGKLTMRHADLFLIDTADDEWFNFDLMHYQEQLVNGRIQMTPEAGLRVFMPDIEKIPPTAANRAINLQWMKNRNLPPPPELAR